MHRITRYIEQMIMKIAVFTLLFLATLGASNPVSADSPNDILIIVNSSVKNEKVSRDDLRAIFLKKRTTWNSGARAVPVHSNDTVLRNEFRKRLLELSEGEEERYWQQYQIQKGEAKPASFGNTLKAVFQLNGSVGYIFRSQFRKGVTNVVLVLPAS